MSYASDDGLKFIKEEGARLPDDYVDPAIDRLSDERWLMVAAKFEVGGGLFVPRKLYLAGSSDGLSWQFEPEPLVDAGAGQIVDPTFVSAGDAQYRIYYGYKEMAGPGGGFRILSGVLDVPASAPESEPPMLEEELAS